MIKTHTNKETTISRKVSELRKAENKLNRYEKRLVLEGLRTAKEEGLTFLINEHVEYTDVTYLVELSKGTHPSLYRKHTSLKQKYISDMKELADKVNN